MMIKKFIIIFIFMFICLPNFGRSLVKQTQKFPKSFSTRILIIIIIIIIKNRIKFNIIMTLFYSSKVFTITNQSDCKSYYILSYTYEKVKEKINCMFLVL
jgi:hypothetical protein